VNTVPKLVLDGWEIHEQMCLKILQEEESSFHQRVNAVYMRFWDSSDDIKRILDELNECATLLFNRRALGNDLLNHGRPAFDQKLDALIRYEQGQFARFTKQYGIRLRAEATPGRSQFSTKNRFVPDPGKAFDLKAWQSVFNRTCIACGHLLGESYYFRAVCPICGIYPRPR
jgi:hypothetical protein